MCIIFRFPKNPDVRLAWISFCGLNATTDNVSNLFLCCSHFLRSDYAEPRAKEFGNVIRLKPRSIPSILKPNVKNRSRVEVSICDDGK